MTTSQSGCHREPDLAVGEVGRRQLARIFVGTSLGAFMWSLGLSIVNVAFPALARSFPHETQTALTWVITAYAIVFGSLMVTGGRLADRIGRRRVFLGGLAVFSFGSVLCASGPDLAAILAGRVVQSYSHPRAWPRSSSPSAKDPGEAGPTPSSPPLSLARWPLAPPSFAAVGTTGNRCSIWRCSGSGRSAWPTPSWFPTPTLEEM